MVWKRPKPTPPPTSPAKLTKVPGPHEDAERELARTELAAYDQTRAELREQVLIVRNQLDAISATLNPGGQLTQTAKEFFALGTKMQALGSALARWDSAISRTVERARREGLG